jgi:hypothetical protein
VRRMDAGLRTTQLAARPSARRRHERLTGIVAAMARQTVTASFEIIAWDERPAGVEGHGAAVVRRRFRGPLQATSVAELLAVETAHGTSYVASERVEGTLDGRSGSFVIQHGGITGAGPGRTFGHVVPGSGTGDLEGLMGDAAFARDDAGTRLTLSYKL